jgi:Family of unknown function (DUF5996)
MEKGDSTRKASAWPPLPLSEWKDTCATLHMWTQIVGKIRMEQSPLRNHWWEVALYVNARGLTTSAIPYGAGVFEIQFDFIDHRLLIQTSQGAVQTLRLEPRSVAAFYKQVMAMLEALGIRVKIWKTPVEIPDPIPFDQDETHASYDPEYAHRFWKILVSADTVFKQFQARFLGKSSPVHFFWGSFDLAVTRFSGRRAPERKDADPITREAYSHEVISAGFWPGSGPITDAAFYSYTVPEPPELSKAVIHPAAASYNTQVSEFILMYDDVRESNSPEETLTEFLQSTYEAGAVLAKWDRNALERAPVRA